MFFRKLKRSWKNIFSIIFGIIIVGNFIIVSLYWGRFDGFNRFMIFVGLLWIIISIKINKFYELLKKMPKYIQIFFKVVIVLFILSLVMVESIIIFYMKTTTIPNADYVIILGCQVDGSIPSIPLLRRIKIATDYLKTNEKTKVIVTGGQGQGENITEAEAMKKVLLQNGISEDRIFEENKSKSTIENFIFSDKLFNLHDKNVIIVTTDYHMFRALSSAKKLNYKNVKAMPSKSHLSVLPVYLLREYMAIVYYKMLGRI